jgi:hypothetical protein
VNEEGLPMEHKDINNASVFLEKMLLPQYEKFIQNNSSSRHALLTTILAYHMFEWVHGKKFGRFCEEEFQSSYPAQVEMYSTLEIAGHLTNGTKYFGNKISKMKGQTGFGSAFSDAFARLGHYPSGPY